ncbi:hypothetical protein HYDPIDRAFT_24920 [Hydnomerulius pinastri MD-312]|nr:hypothetical protein HYDPIDRAFT_24920 [Hydnomerulius pinastri MD-312]
MSHAAALVGWLTGTSDCLKRCIARGAMVPMAPKELEDYFKNTRKDGGQNPYIGRTQADWRRVRRRAIVRDDDPNKMADFDSEDDFPNDFDGFDFSAVPGLQQQPLAIRIPTPEEPSPGGQNLVPPMIRTPSPASLSILDFSDDVDLSFLAAVDELEARALRGTPAAGPSRPPQPLRSPASGGSECGHTTNLTSNPAQVAQIIGFAADNDQSLKRPIQSPDVAPSKKKGKMKAEPHEDLQTILEGYETEISCPICTDIFVGAHIANPCGHTCCGECGYGWLARNRYAPTCAVCRTSLSETKPLLPNFTVDNVVRHHIQALAMGGRPDWQEKGYRFIDWNKRLESWKKEAANIAVEEKAKEAARQRRHQPRYYQVGEYQYGGAPWMIPDEVFIADAEEDLLPRVIHRRGPRRVRSGARP